MTLESIGSMGGTFFLVFAAIVIVFAALMGLKRGVFKSAVRTLSLLASAFVSLFLVKMLLPSLLKMLTKTILESAGGGEGALADIMQAETSFAVLEALVLAIIAPLAFVLIYFVVNKLFLIVCFIVNTVLKPLLGPVEKKIPCRRLFGALISVLGAIVTLVVVATPIGGYTEMIDHTVAHIQESEEHDETADGIAKSLNDLAPLTHGFADSVAVSIPYKMGGNLFYESLTSIHISKDSGVIDKDVNTSLENELIGVLDLIPLADSFGELSFSDIEEMNIDPLRRVAETLQDEESSAIVRIMMADIFATASGKWLAGEDFLSINLMELLEGDAAMFRPSVEVLLSGLANTHVSTVGDDVIELVETFDGIQQTFLYMMAISDAVARGEAASVEDVTKMLESLTPQSAAAMSASMTAVMTQTGIGDDNAAALGGILTNALGEMAELNASGAGEDKIHKEAAALNTVLTLAMNPEAEMTDEKADDLIDSVMDSTILAHSIKNGVNEEEDAAPAMALPEEAADKVQEKIDSYGVENDLDEEQQETLNALSVFFATKTVAE